MTRQHAINEAARSIGPVDPATPIVCRPAGDLEQWSIRIGDGEAEETVAYASSESLGQEIIAAVRALPGAIPGPGYAQLPPDHQANFRGLVRGILAGPGSRRHSAVPLYRVGLVSWRPRLGGHCVGGDYLRRMAETGAGFVPPEIMFPSLCKPLAKFLLQASA